jgi:hypothetical protein
MDLDHLDSNSYMNKYDLDLRNCHSAYIIADLDRLDSNSYLYKSDLDLRLPYHTYNRGTRELDEPDSNSYLIETYKTQTTQSMYHYCFAEIGVFSSLIEIFVGYSVCIRQKTH